MCFGKITLAAVHKMYWNREVLPPGKPLRLRMRSSKWEVMLTPGKVTVWVKETVQTQEIERKKYPQDLVINWRGKGKEGVTNCLG